MMELGFVSAIVPELSLEEVFQVASKEGFECVELMCWPTGRADRRYAGVTHVDVSNFDLRAANQIKELSRKYHVEISALGYYPNPLTPDLTEARAACDHLLKVIDASAMLDVHKVNTFIGRDWTKSIDDNWPRFLATWEPILHHAESVEVKVGIENCPMLFSRDEWPGGKNLAISPAIWRRMFTDIPSPSFGLNYDPSHLAWMHMDYLKPLRDFASRIFHVHAKDVRVEQHRLDEVGILAHPLEYHTPKLPGLGSIDWGKFVSVLGDTGYHGPVCVEVEDRAFEKSLATRKLALRQSHTYLRQFIPRLDGSHS